MADIKPASPAAFGQIADPTTAAFADDAVVRWFVPDRDEYERSHPIFNQWQYRRWNATAYDAHHSLEIRSEWELPLGGPYMGLVPGGPECGR